MAAQEEIWTCYHCSRLVDENNLEVCPICESEPYCSKQCVEADYEAHVYGCENDDIEQDFDEKSLPSTVRALLDEFLQNSNTIVDNSQYYVSVSTRSTRNVSYHTPLLDQSPLPWTVLGRYDFERYLQFCKDFGRLLVYYNNDIYTIPYENDDERDSQLVTDSAKSISQVA